ncbi:hypothetical protein LA080_014801 [Diaporthe eres]|uniref:Uncharacterized protein n=1 Tax=Diaporthe vaccinii TaxID=105482 RepID=A0ABR4FB66_9PEZI|nr:hypothetical protein LA080_014801 [Diaporthe eres]
MPSAEGALRVFQGSSAIAATGFMTLIVQTLLAKYRKRKSQAKSKTTVALSAVTSGDEPQKPTTAAGGSSEHGKAEPDQAWKKPLHEKIAALISQVRSQGADDTAPEIVRAAAAYLLAAEGLLKLRGGGPRPAPGRTLAKLYATASMLVKDTNAATASLQKLFPPDLPKTKAAAPAFLVGLISMVATVVALGAAALAQTMVFRGQSVDLTRFTLRGEPRAAGLPPYLLGLAISAAAGAFRQVVAGLCTVIGLVRPVVMFPANAAFNCLVSSLLPAGLPLGITAVSYISFLAVVAMMTLACAASSEAELLALVEDVDRQNETSVESCVDSNNVGLE